MSFEAFKRQRAPLTGDPAITIQKRGNFWLNPAAYSALGEPQAVELLYDKERNLVALRKAPEDSEYAYVVRPLGGQRKQRQTGNTSWLISGMAFTAYYGIDTGIARRWTCRLDDDLLVLDLNEPSIEVTSNRERTNAPAPSSNATPSSSLPGPASNGSPTALPQVSPDEPTNTPPGRENVS